VDGIATAPARSRRALAHRVEVADREVRIIGSKSNLLQTLTEPAGANPASSGGRSSVLQWRVVDLRELFSQRPHAFEQSDEAALAHRLDHQAIAVTAHDCFVTGQFDSTGMRIAWLRPLRKSLTCLCSGIVVPLQHRPQTSAFLALAARGTDRRPASLAEAGDFATSFSSAMS
jgi:hypothetical protein